MKTAYRVLAIISMMIGILAMVALFLGYKWHLITMIIAFFIALLLLINSHEENL